MCSMKKMLALLENDLRRFYHYRILQIVGVISFLFAAILAFFPDFNASNIFYVTVFILPVIVFSFSLKADIVEGHVLPCDKPECDPKLLLISKILSALLLQLVPIIMYILVLELYLKIDIAYVSLFFAYILSATLHIIIGLSLSIISKTDKILSFNYIVYILVFCTGPIFLSNGLIPIRFQYYLLFSPAYLSGILIDNILSGMYYSPVWLILLSLFLQVAYGVLLSFFVIKPFFQAYVNQFGREVK